MALVKSSSAVFVCCYRAFSYLGRTYFHPHHHGIYIMETPVIEVSHLGHRYGKKSLMEVTLWKHR